MKLFNVIAIATVTGALVSFQYGKTIKKDEVVKYELDKSASKLAWKGGNNENNFHTGVVNFSEGSLEMNKGNVSNGTFTVDLSTIKVTDAGLPDGKKDYLAGHLKNEDFFNVTKYAVAKVTLGEYKDGKLTTTVNLLGVDVKQDVPVVIKKSEKGATISGKFDFDFTAANIPGTIKKEGDTESISPVFSFDLNLTVKEAK
jgi:polyisoprenoid-binding protein YceI